jgi:hypothetical protein
MLEFLFDWLSRADPPVHADAIFVLAGLKARKVFAIQLLKQGVAPRLLLSVGRFEIRRFPELGLPQTIDLLQLAQSIPPPGRHFFVLFENAQFTVQRVPVRVLGTLREMDALADWLNAYPQISSLLVVSSETIFVAVPEEATMPNPQNWWNDGSTRRMVLFECLKIACYMAFLPFWKLARPWRSKTISAIAPD